MRYYNVQVIYKAGLETIVYAANREDAKTLAEREAEMAGDHIETVAVNVSETFREPDNKADVLEGK